MMAPMQRICQQAIVLVLGCGIVFGYSRSLDPPKQKTKSDATLPLSPVGVSGVLVHKQYWSRPILWQGREYEPTSAIPTLVDAVLDDNGDAESRRVALKELNRLATHLGGTQWIAQLVARYDTIEDTSEKATLLKCFSISEDPRAFRVFSGVLEKEKENILRLQAASGLANWNIRRGVEDLIKLFPSTAKTSWLEVGVLAQRNFESLNKRKGWGCPTGEINADVQTVMQANGIDAATDTLIREYLEWFEANKHRFPEWKPGDPLPALPEPETDKPDK